MKLRFLAPLLILTTIIVTACASPVAEQPDISQSASPGTELSRQSMQDTGGWEQTVEVDEQGAVVMEVTPLNLNTPAEKLEFEISMNTHSVDLSMDLAQFATLTTDAGITVGAARWDAPRGGHHVNGKLLFPTTVDGNPVLAGATDITIQIRDVDASLRTFVWHVQ
jgi:hypothetical protein